MTLPLAGTLIGQYNLILSYKTEDMNNSNKKTISNANGYKNLQSLLGLPQNLSASLFFDCLSVYC